MDLEISVSSADDTSFIANIKLAKAGDKNAFINLIEENKVSLYSISRRMLSDRYDIEDAIQETVLKAWKGISKLNTDAYFKTWLIRILINECIKISKKKSKFVNIEDYENKNCYIEDKYVNIDIDRAISSLERDLKLVIILYYYEEMSVADISQVMDKPEGTIKSRLFRAREKLYSQLKEGEVIGKRNR